jgi:E3 ubiquitin-protein ligase RNF213
MAYKKAIAYPNRKESNLLPVFVFDEIGLAELSKYNPLKVLHSLLEVENRDIGFVGISNWRLDASKMNRALYLARPDPGEEDLKFTAICIFNQICKGMSTHHNMIKNLASAYSDLKLHLKAKKPEYQDFYGLRDFYHLIKVVSRKIANDTNMREDNLI